MKVSLQTILLAAYMFSECLHYVRQWRRFIHLDTTLLPSKSRDVKAVVAIVLAKNPGLLQRLRTLDLRHTNHIRTPEDLNECMTPWATVLRASHVLTTGGSRLRWRYIPLPLSGAKNLIRIVGELYVKRKGFTREWHRTKDGYYAVWSKFVEGTRPIVVFPGLGLGAIPYATLATKLNRTVHMVEVPNFGSATPLSPQPFTSETLYDIVSKYARAPDILAHSFGTCVATMFLNESQCHGSQDRGLLEFTAASQFLRRNIVEGISKRPFFSHPYIQSQTRDSKNESFLLSSELAFLGRGRVMAFRAPPTF